jgi:hypothetical protein
MITIPVKAQQIVEVVRLGYVRTRVNRSSGNQSEDELVTTTAFGTTVVKIVKMMGSMMEEEADDEGMPLRSFSMQNIMITSTSPPRRRSKSKPKRRNSESHSHDWAKWLAVLPLALEAAHLLSEPKGGWETYLKDGHKKELEDKSTLKKHAKQ